MKRRQFVAALGGAVVWPLAADAQAERVRRIGLMGSTQAQPIERFRKKLRELGYVEGKNLIVEYRYAEGRDELYASFATELVGIPVELIVVWGTPAAFAAKNGLQQVTEFSGTWYLLMSSLLAV